MSGQLMEREREMPLFYRDPQVLRSAAHAALRIKPGDYRFAAEANASPLAVIEFASAMRHYPIVFSSKDGFPLVIFGLGSSNRFVSGGQWAERAYVPAYVRRYPFAFSAAGEDGFALAIDVGADNVIDGGGEGEPLFIDGKPAPLAENAVAFCGEFQGAHIQTRAFADALRAHDLLVEQRADARPASGAPLALSGFMVVDQTRFDALPDEVVLDWHRKGWSALVHFHRASLARFADLLAHEAENCS